MTDKEAREYCEQWYAVRLKRIQEWAEENGHGEVIANIIANGTSESTEPPTYDQQMNILRHQLETKDSLVEALQAEIEFWRSGEQVKIVQELYDRHVGIIEAGGRKHKDHACPPNSRAMCVFRSALDRISMRA